MYSLIHTKVFLHNLRGQPFNFSFYNLLVFNLCWRIWIIIVVPLVEKWCFKQVLEKQFLEAGCLLYGIKWTVYFILHPVCRTPARMITVYFNNSSMFTIKLKLPLDLPFFCVFGLHYNWQYIWGFPSTGFCGREVEFFVLLGIKRNLCLKMASVCVYIQRKSTVLMIMKLYYCSVKKVNRNYWKALGEVKYCICNNIVLCKH